MNSVRARSLSIAVALALALISLAATALIALDLERTKSELSDLRGDTTGAAISPTPATGTGAADFMAEIEELRSDIEAIEQQLFAVDIAPPPPAITGDPVLTRRVSDLEDTFDDLERRVLPHTLDDTVSWSDLNSVSRELDGLRRCVNDYMDTIGAWSNNVNRWFDYFYC